MFCLKGVLVNCDQCRAQRQFVSDTVLRRPLLFSFCLFCRFLDGSLILNRILWSMTTKQSCFISAANDLAQSNVIQSAKLKDNLPENTQTQIGMHELIHTETLVIARARVQPPHPRWRWRIHAWKSTKCGLGPFKPHFRGRSMWGCACPDTNMHRNTHPERNASPQGPH